MRSLWLGSISEAQKAPVSLPALPATIDETAQALEQLRRALDFVEDHELIRVLGEIKLGFGEFGAIDFGFEIELDRRPNDGHLQRHGGFTRLARPQHGNRRTFRERQQ